MTDEIYQAMERMILGEPLQRLTRLASVESTVRKVKEALLSNYPLRELGWTQDGPLFLTEEDRESHIHVLGSPGEGKSKFLELLLRQDIDRGYGACLIDPSDNGDTCYKVLKYAIKKGYEKIVLIDPHDFESFRVVPCVNPIHHHAPAPAVIGNLMDSCRVLWGQSSFADTPRIQKYLPAVLAAIHAAECTLAEARWFMEKDKLYEYKREKIIERLHPYDLHRRHLEAVFNQRDQYVFDNFQSTVNRLNPFLDPTMELVFGKRKGLDFNKLIADKYLILVNLDPEGVFGQEHQRLLGTIIINEITYGMSRLRHHGWQGRYYLYIDEAGDYATSKLSYILDKKRKSGLSLTLSHQRFDQFGDKDVSSAVYGGTKIKVLFNTASRDDRDKMLRMMYSGELTEKDTTFFASQLRKGNCLIKNNKQPPATLEVTNIPDIQIKDKVLQDFKSKLYANRAFYTPVSEIRAEINNRFAVPSHSGAAPLKPSRPVKKSSTSPPPPTVRKPESTPGKQDDKPNLREDSASDTGSSIFDDIAARADVLRQKKGRERSSDNRKGTEAG